MTQLTPATFYHYIDTEKVHYIYNPLCDFAFRSFDETGKDGKTRGRLFGKGRGKEEKEFPFDDEEYNEAWMFKIVMTKSEYDSF